MLDYEGVTWRVPSILSGFRFDTFLYQYQAETLQLRYRFDAAIHLSEIDLERFNRSITGQLLNRTNIRKKFKTDSKTGSVHLFVSGGKLEEGSIWQNLSIGVFAVGSFVANYADFKQGVSEIYADAAFLAEVVETGLRSSKLPNEDEELEPDAVAIIERRRRLNSKKRNS